MPNEPRQAGNQHLAFAYLRDRARRAHAEGDGILVNSLCSLALSQAESLAKKKQLQLGLAELKWAFVLPIFWLIDDWMFRRANDALTAAFPPSPEHDALLGVLKTYYFLAHEPLANIDEQVKVLTEMKFESLGEGNQCEDFVLLTHLIELVWFRDPDEARWQVLATDWIKRAPAWCKKPIENLKLRLALQTRLTVPSKKFPQVAPSEAVDLPDELRLAELWIYAINADSSRLDAAIKRMSAITAPKSHVARLLFDYHHWNRWPGEPGEDQAIGLARRRLFTASTPLLVFDEIRDSRLAINLGRLFRLDEVGNATLRFHVFQLSMLWELSALRLWDWPAWQQANRMQSEAYLEAAKWNENAAWLAATGLLLAARSSSYKPQNKDPLFRMAISRLEFADEKTLTKLVEGLLVLYTWQYYRTYELLVDLSDLVPVKQWVAVAKWGLAFLEAMRHERTRGSTAYPLYYLTEIVRYAEKNSEIWELLLSEVVRMAGNSLLWRSENGSFLDAWLNNAPIDAAKKVGFALLAVQTADQNERSQRFELLRDAEKARAELKGTFSPELQKLATSPIEAISVLEKASPEEHDKAKGSLKQRVENLLKAAVPLPGEKQFSAGGLSIELSVIQWDESDLPLLERLIEAVDNPAVLTSHLPQLLSCIQLLIISGPRSFADRVFPRFQSWVEHPPVGREPFRAGGPFSVMQWGDSSLDDIPVMIGWIGFQLLLKLAEPVAPVLAKWIHNSAMNPAPRAIPIMVYVGIPAAIHLPVALRTDLLSVCQTLIAHLLLRHRTEPEHGYTLATALRYLGQMMRKQEHPLVRWDTEAAEQSLSLLVPKFSLALVEASKSTNADVRAATARFLRHLEEWMELPPVLREVIERLTTDNRARVRFHAHPRSLPTG